MHFEVTNGSKEKKTYSFSQNKILIGRGSEVDLQLEGEEISRKHLILEYIDGKYYVQDLGATNGVYVNQDKVAPHDRVEAQTFFPIQVGAHIFIQLLDDGPEEMVGKKSPEVKRSISSGTNAEKTSTKKMTTPPPKLKPKENSKSDKSANHKIIAVVFLLGVYFIYNQMSEETPGEAPVSVKEEKANNPKEEVQRKYELLLTPTQLREKTRLEELYKQVCRNTNVQNICEKISPSLQSPEGAVLEEKRLTVFRNIALLMKTSFDGNLFRLPGDRRLEFLHSYLILSLASESFIKNSDIERIEMIDYRIEEGFFIPKSSTVLWVDRIRDIYNPIEIMNQIRENQDLNKYDNLLRPTHTISFFDQMDKILKEMGL
jgi:pSer/pThr/pTyr-binding forkhead associated (FHA) protein